MPTKPLDPIVNEILQRYNLDARECLWNAHGAWVMYHRYLEQVAAKAGITFSEPRVVVADGANVSIIAFGILEGRTEWTFGEASPSNNKNAYPWAMAEKRCKDRLVLKLLGLHGFVYSEEEADEFKDSKPKIEVAQDSERNQTNETFSDILENVQCVGVWDRKKILYWWNSPALRAKRQQAGLTPHMIEQLKAEINRLYPPEEASEPNS